jgi:hypothetical protein
MGVAKELVAPIDTTPLAPAEVWFRNKVAINDVTRYQLMARA